MSEIGLFVVISAPSGTGKGTVISEVMKKNAKSRYSVSVTTRKKRGNEKDGVDYIFTDVDTFHEMVSKGEFMEWVEYCGNYYGTPVKNLEECCREGYDVFLDIDVQGAVNIKERYPESLHIFMLPPSFEELKRRIEGRGTETKDVIGQRIRQAFSELEQIPKYDYVFFNEEIDKSVENVLTIIRAEKMKQIRNQDILKSMRREQEQDHDAKTSD